MTPPPLSPIAEEPPAIPTATPATDALAAEVDLPRGLGAGRLEGRRGADPTRSQNRAGTVIDGSSGRSCSSALHAPHSSRAPRPAFASVVAPVACWAGLAARLRADVRRGLRRDVRRGVTFNYTFVLWGWGGE